MAQTVGLGSTPGSDWGCITMGAGIKLCLPGRLATSPDIRPNQTPFVHVFQKRCAWQSGTMMASKASFGGISLISGSLNSPILMERSTRSVSADKF